jgi:hypothetical protein
VSQDLLAVAIDNHEGKLAQQLDLGRPDDAELAAVLSLLKGVDRWIIGLPDAETLSFRADATTLDAEAASTVARTIEAQARLGSAGLHALPIPEDPTGTDVEVQGLRHVERLLTNLKATSEGRSLVVRSEAFGTFADLAPLIKAGILDAMSGPKAEQAKADPKAEKR